VTAAAFLLLTRDVTKKRVTPDKSKPGLIPLTIAELHGLRFVYTDNVHDPEGGRTTRPGCGAAVIDRDWYAIGRYQLTDDGRYARCGSVIPGRFDGPVGRWGRRWLPVSQATAGLHCRGVMPGRGRWHTSPGESGYFC